MSALDVRPAGSGAAASAPAGAVAGAPRFVPTWIGQLDLGMPFVDVLLPARDGEPYGEARLLVRLHDQPLGFVTLTPQAGVVAAEAIVAGVHAQLGPALTAHLRRDGLAAAQLSPLGIPEAPGAPCRMDGPHATGDPFVSVIICTRDRSDSLRRTLRSLLADPRERLEVVLVDNAPRTSATRDVIAELADPRLRYVLEERPGLSVARNRGAAEATGDVLAFTDDDVVVDAGWLDALLRGFTRAAHVGCVTGLVPGAESESTAQAYFESKLDWATFLEPALYDMGKHRAPYLTYPYSSGVFGAGANFALSRATWERVGRFDEALGAGSPSKGGEDLDYFLRVVLADVALAYEPAALVWHYHRRETDALVAQMYGYGSGLTAYVFKHLLFTPGTARKLLGKVPIALVRFTRAARETGRAVEVPAGAQRREWRGLLDGPWLYLKGRRAALPRAWWKRVEW